MSELEQARRMRLLRANVATYDAHWWSRQIITDATSVNRVGFRGLARDVVVAERASA
jgi:hypothetical protein